MLAAVLLAPAAVVAQEAENARGVPAADELAAVVVCPVPATSADTAPTEPDIDSFPLATVSEAPATRPVGTWDGTWAPMPPAPIVGRSGAASGYAAWEDRFYVWGGRDADGTLLNDGAAFLIEDQAWKALPESPLVPRERFGFDTGQLGLTIWGGVDASGQPLDDGARIELSRAKRPKMSWTLLPPAPLTPGPASLSGDYNTTYAVTPGAEPGNPPRFATLDYAERDKIDLGRSLVTEHPGPRQDASPASAARHRLRDRVGGRVRGAPELPGRRHRGRELVQRHVAGRVERP